MKANEKELKGRGAWMMRGQAKIKTGAEGKAWREMKRRGGRGKAVQGRLVH
jgi:hypothetical protein